MIGWISHVVRRIKGSDQSCNALSRSWMGESLWWQACDGRKNALLFPSKNAVRIIHTTCSSEVSLTSSQYVLCHSITANTQITEGSEGMSTGTMLIICDEMGWCYGKSLVRAQYGHISQCISYCTCIWCLPVTVNLCYPLSLSDCTFFF